LWKEATSFVMSVYPSVRTEQPGSHWTDFHEIWYLSNFFRKSVEKIQVSLKPDNNNGLYMKINWKLRSYLAEFFSDWEMFQTVVVEKIKICICTIAFFRKSCRLWDSVRKYCRVGQATDDNRTRRMRFACWIPKATGTHSVSNTYCFSTGCTNAPHCYVMSSACLVITKSYTSILQNVLYL
jgi:hypothetical protein